MKLLCTILAFLVLILSVQPVCDAATTNNSSCCTGGSCNEELEQDQNSSDDNHDEGCNSGCNPFQSCGCCAFSVIVPFTIPLVVSPSFFTPRVNWGILPIGITEEPSSGFWQPPRTV